MIFTITLDQLQEASDNGTTPNDLLPPRAGDKLGGQLGRRFIESFYDQIKSGTYHPTRCLSIAVPKSNFSARVAAMMAIEDRILYSALVSRMRARIEKSLMPKEVVFFPRGTEDGKHWREFEKAPVIDEASYIVVSDVAGFYESIDHRLLKKRLLESTGLSTEAQELCDFLETIMGSPRGLPQGLSSSDALASVYLSSVDAAMIREGYDYFRHGDDIRIAAADFSQGKQALYVLQERLREMRLLPNTLKCKILKKHTYNEQLNEIENTKRVYTERIKQAQAEELLDRDDEILEELLGEDKVWSWYHNDTLQSEIIAEVRELIKPTVLVVMKAIFDDLLESDKRDDLPLSNEAFHQLLVASLTIFKSVKDGVALKYCAHLIVKYPDKVNIVTGYLQSLPATQNNAVDEAIKDVLKDTGYKTGWELANLIHSVTYRKFASDNVSKLIQVVAENEENEWIARVEAINALSSIGKLERHVALKMWRIAPVIFRGEIVRAVAKSESLEWAKHFLATINDPSYTAIKNNEISISGTA